MLLLQYHRFGVSFNLTSDLLTINFHVFYSFQDNCQCSRINHGVLLISSFLSEVMQVDGCSDIGIIT